MIPRTSSPRLLFLPLLFLLAIASSGCMWGVVKDARNGAPIADASVWYFDANGNMGTATTDANGLYYFETSEGAAAMGPATFAVVTQNAGTQSEKRAIDYAENPNATLANPAGFWEVQNFEVAGQPGSYHDVTQGCSITFPTDWFAMPAPEPDEDELTSYVMAMGMGGGLSMAACMVQSAPLPPGGFPDNWWRDAPDDIKVAERGTAQIAGKTATRLIMTFKIEGDRSFGDEVKALLFVLERAEQGWMIMCMTDVDDFASAQQGFETIAKSFKFD